LRKGLAEKERQKHFAIAIEMLPIANPDWPSSWLNLLARWAEGAERRRKSSRTVFPI